MADRISRRADLLSNQCKQAAVGIGAATTWPASAPDDVAMTGHGTALDTKLLAINAAETQLKTARQELAVLVDAARDDMVAIDRATDFLFGPDGAQKSSFGLAPKKGENSAAGAPEQVIIVATREGAQPASIFLDWDSLERCVYEVQWFSDAPLTQKVGSQTVTSSELEIGGLTRGSQYWFRVRAVRGGQEGPWSDQATRVANV